MAAVENFLTNNHGIAAFGQQGAAADVPRATFYPPITPSDSSVCRVSRRSDYGDILKIMGVCDQSNSTAVYIIVAANNDALTINFVGNQIVIPNFRFHAGCSHAAWYEFRRIVQQTFPEFLRMIGPLSDISVYSSDSSLSHSHWTSSPYCPPEVTWEPLATQFAAFLIDSDVSLTWAYAMVLWEVCLASALDFPRFIQARFKIQKAFNDIHFYGIDDFSHLLERNLGHTMELVQNKINQVIDDLSFGEWTDFFRSCFSLDPRKRPSLAEMESFVCGNATPLFSVAPQPAELH